MIPIRSYIQSSSISLIGKIVVVLGTLGNLFFLNAILGRDEFGLFMMGFSLITVLSLIISVGGQSLLLYHVARKPKDKDGVAGQVLWIVLALSSAMALLLFLLSGPIAALFQNRNWQTGSARSRFLCPHRPCSSRYRAIGAPFKRSRFLFLRRTSPPTLFA